MAGLWRFGDFELDEPRFELRRGGKALAVQPKVLELILYLARHRERVVGKQELFDELWAGTLVTEASLTQALSLARRALGDTPREQHTIRTVRRRGLQFVAPIEPAPEQRGAPPPSSVRRSTASTPTITTLQQTAEAPRTPSARKVLAPRIYVVLQGHLPEQGGASQSLSGWDEVEIGRGSKRRFAETGEVTRMLSIALPDRQLSRRHARLVRGPHGWFLIDEDSRNGTTVQGERVSKLELTTDTRIVCGTTVLRYVAEVDEGEPFESLESAGADDELVPTVTPGLRRRRDELFKLARSMVPVLITGPSGAGKTHLAERLHRVSGRPGALARLDAATSTHEPAAALQTLSKAEDGSVIIDNLHRLNADVAPILTSALERAPRTRLISTSVLDADELVAALPAELVTRLLGYRFALPPLASRTGDLGALIASIVREHELSLRLSAEACEALTRHVWAGHVRELRHVLEQASSLAGGDAVTMDHLPAELRDG